jgi:glycosyltransferase involved in cell wall biosynthesis
MKIFINRKLRRSPWGGGVQFATGLSDFLNSIGHTVTNQYDPDVDIILMIDPRDDEGFGDINHLLQYKSYLKSNGKNVKVVHRINDSDIARGTNFLVDLNIKANSIIADQTIFISEWLQNHYIEKGFTKNSVVIRNGCNKDWFFPAVSKNEHHEKIKVVTHHWSDNYNKGFDAYIELDKQLSFRNDIEFTYVGRYYKGYTPKNTVIIDPLYGKALGEELRKHDVYLTSAKYEACGMHHIEASACGLPVIYHQDGGGINEMCKKHGIMFHDTSKVCELIKQAFDNKDFLKNQIDYSSIDSKSVNLSYLKVFQNL